MKKYSNWTVQRQRFKNLWEENSWNLHKYITILIPLMSVCWLVGSLVGQSVGVLVCHDFLIGRNVTYPCFNIYNSHGKWGRRLVSKDCFTFVQHVSSGLQLYTLFGSVKPSWNGHGYPWPTSHVTVAIRYLWRKCRKHFTSAKVTIDQPRIFDNNHGCLTKQQIWDVSHGYETSDMDIWWPRLRDVGHRYPWPVPGVFFHMYCTVQSCIYTQTNTKLLIVFAKQN